MSDRPAGLCETRRCQATGRQVSLYDGGPAGMDIEAGRWQTVCEDHGWVISHATYAVARSWLPVANEWCEECMAVVVVSS